MSSHSPQRENPMSQEEEIDHILTQMKWDEDANPGVHSGDDEGPQMGQGAYVARVWCNPLDPHPVPPRERCSRSEFNPDYVPSPIRVRTCKRACIIKFRGLRVMTCRIVWSM